MLQIAGLFTAVLVVVFLWDMFGGPTPKSVLRTWRRRRRRRRHL